MSRVSPFVTGLVLTGVGVAIIELAHHGAHNIGLVIGIVGVVLLLVSAVRNLSNIWSKL